jgi:radical SAM superfamily enzyme YgiQ (UPF0313 family)
MTDKVLVINEPFVDNFCRTQRWAARTRGRVLRAPDWLAYTTSVLEKDHVDVELHDFPAKNWGKSRFKDLVKDKQPKIVVLDSTTPSIYSDIECAHICKSIIPDIKIIMVGPHVSTCYKETLLDANGAVDAVAIGEYEYTVRDFVREIQSGNSDLENVSGLAWLSDGIVKKNAHRPLITNLDELPFPAWHQLNLWDYFDGTKLYPYIDIIGGRGCPYQCSFCLWPQVMHGNRYRLRSPENILEEMQWVLSQWPKTIKGEFFFEDDTFTVNKNRAHQMCALIIKSKLNCTWSVNSRADVLDVELLKHMKAAGCRLVLVGFESGSQSILDQINKNMKLETMTQFIHLVKQVGLQIHGCFVLGLPGETEATMKETIDFALKNPMDTVQFSGAVPFPGTKYFDYAVKNDLLIAKRWDEWLNDGEQSSVIDYPGLNRQAVENNIDKALKKFYFRPTYMLRFLFATQSKKDLYRKIRGAYNFMTYLAGKK